MRGSGRARVFTESQHFRAHKARMKAERLLHPAERLVALIVIAIAALDAGVAVMRATPVDLMGYGGAGGSALLLIALGIVYRASGRSERIGSACIASGLFILFTLTLSLFNYLLMPHWSGGTIDAALAELDAALFGYRWPEFMAWCAQFPLFNEAMRYAYLSTLPQIALVVIALGLAGKARALHLMLLTTVFSGLLTVGTWALVPSLGPSAMLELPAEIAIAARPVVGGEYGAAIAALFVSGADRLAPDEIRGLIAFPSYHIVLALIATWYARGLPWLLALLVPVNLLVIPGVLAHGGHHVVDIPAGLAVFAFAAFGAHRFLTGRESTGAVAAPPGFAPAAPPNA
jgi:hypothetical protein